MSVCYSFSHVPSLQATTHLDVDQLQGLERGRLHNGHVVGGADGLACDVCACARTHVRHPARNALAEGLHHLFGVGWPRVRGEGQEHVGVFECESV